MMAKYFVYECIIIKDFCPLVKVTKSQQHFCFNFKISNKIMGFFNGIYQKIVFGFLSTYFYVFVSI